MMFIYLQRLVFRYVLEYQHVVGHPRRQKYFNIIKLSSHRISNINFPNYSMVAMHVSYSRRWKYLTTNFNRTKISNGEFCQTMVYNCNSYAYYIMYKYVMFLCTCYL